MKMGCEIRKVCSFEFLENAVMEAAMYVSQWRYNHLIKYAKIKYVTVETIFCCYISANGYILHI